MSKEKKRWQKMNAMLDQALELPEEQREAFLRKSGGSDPSIADEVLELLQHYDEEDAIPGVIAQQMDSLLDEEGQRSSLIGLHVGPFELIREIARGGMGQVFEARRRDGDFEQTVAIKLLPGHRLDEEARLRFAVERRLLAGLQHPNIAQLLDGGTLDDGMPYIVMEYVDGVAIDQYCGERELTNQQVIRLILKVCSAVELAHQALIVHRDIKPANILVDASGTPKLLDFGIAKLLDVRRDDAKFQTRSGLLLLTPAYASPEQIEGGEITTAVDVYGLGLLAYKLLTGHLPYRAESTDQRELVRQIVSNPPEAPSEVLISRDYADGTDRPKAWRRHQHLALKGDLDAIILTALRKDPDRRYANVAALADDLERHLANRPIQARRETLGYRLGLFVRRHPIAVPATMLATMGAIIAAVSFVWLLANERDQAVAAEQRANRTAQFAASLLSRTNAQQDSQRQTSIGEILGNAAQRVEDELADAPLIALPMHIALADSLHSWGRYEESQAQIEKALVLADDEGSTRDQARALKLSATLAQDMGRMEEALDLYRQTEVLWRQIGNSEGQATALTDIAIVLNEMGSREKAVLAFEKALEASKEAYGEDHAEVAWLRNNLGWNLHTLGRYEEAMQHYLAALAVQERGDAAVFDRALTRSNLAGLHYDVGQLDEAEVLWRQALADFVGIYGIPGHAAVARGQNLLAVALMALGRLDEALEQSNLAVAGNLELLGESHRWTAFTMTTNALILTEIGQLDEALKQLDSSESALAAQAEPGDSAFADIALARGLVAIKRKDWVGAQAVLERGKALIEALTSKGRTSIDRVDFWLAVVRAEQGIPGARQLAQSVVDRRFATYGEDDWRTRLLEAHLALPPFQAQPDDEALAYAQATLAAVASQVTRESPRVRRLADRIDAAVAAREVQM